MFIKQVFKQKLMKNVITQHTEMHFCRPNFKNIDEPKYKGPCWDKDITKLALQMKKMQLLLYYPLERLLFKLFC